MVEAAAVRLGKGRTCLQKVCSAVSEHGGPHRPKNTFLDDFVHFCPFLPVLGLFGAEYDHFGPKCPKSPLKKGTFLVKKTT